MLVRRLDKHPGSGCTPFLKKEWRTNEQEGQTNHIDINKNPSIAARGQIGIFDKSKRPPGGRNRRVKQLKITLTQTQDAGMNAVPLMSAVEAAVMSQEDHAALHLPSTPHG